MKGYFAVGLVVALALSVASCGSISHPDGTAASSSARQSSPSASSMPSVTPSSSWIPPSVSPTPVANRWAVLYGADTSDTYNLGLLALDGRLVANLTPKQQFHATGKLVMGQNVPVALLPYSASDDRLYYLDGVVLKYVTPSGGGSTIRTLDAGSREYAFAVAPDDSRIAIAEFDYSSDPPAFHLWIEDLGGGNRIDLTLGSIAYAWPFGWYSGHLIVVETKPYQVVSTEGPWFLPYAMTAHLIDPGTGTEAASLCSWPVATHALCVDRSGGTFQGLFVESWDGHRVQEPQVGPNDCYPTGILSPDGVSIASMDFGGAGCVASSSIVISDAFGRRTKLATAGYPEAYFDETHLIYKTSTNEFEHYAMNLLDLRTGQHWQIDFMNGSCRACTSFGVLPPF